jgi:hypothetical protein
MRIKDYSQVLASKSVPKNGGRPGRSSLQTLQGASQPRRICELRHAKIAARRGHWVCRSYSWRGTGRGQERDRPPLSGAARRPGKYLCPLSKAHQKARTANGTGGENAPKRAPLERRHQSSRIHDAQARRCNATNRQICRIALRRAARNLCGRSAARPKGDAGAGGKDAPRRGAPCAARIARSPTRGPQWCASTCGPERRLRSPFPANLLCFRGRPSRQRGEPARRKDVGEGQA